MAKTEFRATSEMSCQRLRSNKSTAYTRWGFIAELSLKATIVHASGDINGFLKSQVDCGLYNVYEASLKTHFSFPSGQERSIL